jgi:hypothetical protein
MVPMAKVVRQNVGVTFHMGVERCIVFTAPWHAKLLIFYIEYYSIFKRRWTPLKPEKNIFWS